MSGADLVEAGGLVLAAIVAVSMIAWVRLLRRWLDLRTEWRASAGGRVAAGIEASVRALHARGDATDADLQSIVKQERRRLDRGLSFIAASVGALPLLGLLGTVLGMMETFQALTLHGPGARGERMAAGISQALVTTEAGLVAAIALLAGLGFVRARSRRLLETGRRVAHDLHASLARRPAGTEGDDA